MDGQNADAPFLFALAPGRLATIGTDDVFPCC